MSEPKRRGRPKKVKDTPKLENYLPKELSLNEMAELIHASIRTVYSLESQGAIEREKNGKFLLAKTIPKLFDYYRKRRSKSSDLNEARAELIKRKLAVIDGDLIPKELQDDWQRVVVGTIANNLDEAPARYAKLFHELAPEIAQERLMKVFGDEGIKGKLYAIVAKIRDNPKVYSSDEIEVDAELV